MNHKAHLKPYLINAFYTWAIDLEFTPLIEVNHLFLKNQNILLENKSSNFIFNIHPSATRNMIFSKIGITFETTINNETNIINLPYIYLEKIFCKEDGYGIKFSQKSAFESINHGTIHYEKHLTENDPFNNKSKSHLVLVK